MSDTTFEEVRRCPQCAEPGEVQTGGRLAGAPRGSSSLRITCRNSRCRWFNTNWLAQVRADGTFPPALLKRTKMFPALPDVGSSVTDSLETLHDLTSQPGAEIRR